MRRINQYVTDVYTLAHLDSINTLVDRMIFGKGTSAKYVLSGILWNQFYFHVIIPRSVGANLQELRGDFIFRTLQLYYQEIWICMIRSNSRTIIKCQRIHIYFESRDLEFLTSCATTNKLVRVKDIFTYTTASNYWMIHVVFDIACLTVK